ncbi:hypothetical protein NHX12_006006 [Muraenolepis orangiensis]|uniref:Uncharacterized protein n=1 Tax=Muraenolepis orangiensis TaxID=630683 RepID=A0A9Q0DW49_9TELE|nr:hypothetical protein NHX12_006006 [Muraenolepis orangiensis]
MELHSLQCVHRGVLRSEILTSHPELDRAHRSLASQPAPGGKSRPVILRFHRFQIKDLVIREARRRDCRRLHESLRCKVSLLHDDPSTEVRPTREAVAMRSHYGAFLRRDDREACQHKGRDETVS